MTMRATMTGKQGRRISNEIHHSSLILTGLEPAPVSFFRQLDSSSAASLPVTMQILQIIAISALAMMPTALAGTLSVVNSCSFAIYCGGANNNGDDTPTFYVPAGTSWTSTLTAPNNNVGVALKCATNPGLLNPYQMEIAIQNGRAWLDLSAVDGDPFLAYHRHAEIPGVRVLSAASSAPFRYIRRAITV
ncbi:hypothetical protein F5Y18DRAFT_377377 [Xylariaceae sp. FL1019]|nr:hypothetical protein F5Y18DRAFT_377377 [Xylariaceae sp. FL1019]